MSEKDKVPLGRRIHAIGAGLMIIGSPFAAFYSFGASFMFFIVGFLWFGLVLLAELNSQKSRGSQ